MSKKTDSPTTEFDFSTPLMSVAEVAAFLNVTETHVRNLCDRGELWSTNIAAKGARRQLRIPRASVEAFLKPANPLLGLGK